MTFQILQLVCSDFLEKGSKTRPGDEGWQKIGHIGFIIEPRFRGTGWGLHASVPLPMVGKAAAVLLQRHRASLVLVRRLVNEVRNFIGAHAQTIALEYRIVATFRFLTAFINGCR